jgi:hypothetical protein
VACGGEHVHILNGFDVPMKLSIELEEGGTKTFTVPARGSVRAGMVGKAEVKVTTESGEEVATSSAFFGPKDKKGDQCQRMLNIQGAAAVVQEDLEYGDGFGTPNYRLAAGDISDDFCTASYVFEDPPEAITVDSMGPAGRNLGWVHYLGDGDWKASVDALLKDQGEWKGQSRGKAQRIVGTVVLADPDNPALADLEKRFAKEKLVWPDAAYWARAKEEQRKQRERAKKRAERKKKSGD